MESLSADEEVKYDALTQAFQALIARPVREVPSSFRRSKGNSETQRSLRLRGSRTCAVGDRAPSQFPRSRLLDN